MLNNAFRVAHLNLPSEAFNSSIHRQKSHVEQCVSCCTSRSTSIEYQPFIHQKHSIPVYTCKKAMLNNEFHVAHLNPPSEAFKSSIHRQKSHVEQCVSCCTSKSTIRGIQFHYTREKSHVEQCVSCCTSKSTIRGLQFQYTRAKKPC